MRRKERVLVLRAGASFLLGACSAARTSQPGPMETPPSPPSLRRQTVAVLPFANDGLSGRERLDFLSAWLPDTIAAALQSSGELRVVERRELLRILEE